MTRWGLSPGPVFWQHGRMFDTLKAQLAGAAEKLAHLRRFL
jgi:hypothetical protein